MLNVEIRFVVGGQEVSLGSFAEAIVGEVRSSVREEIDRTLSQVATNVPKPPQESDSKMPPKAVSVREAARLLSISPRTLDKYVALKVIPTVRVGRRVLVPMKSVNEVVSKAISRKHYGKPTQ